MTAALSIDFGNSYTKVGIRRGQNETSQVLRSKADLQYDEDNLRIPTVAARVIKNGKELWLFGTDVKLGSKGSVPQVFRNWKPRFFLEEVRQLEDQRSWSVGKNQLETGWEDSCHEPG